MKKIAILGLHLNYGGVEEAIINQANALAQDFDVELAITYKITEPVFPLNPRVKVVYLTNCLPNRDEFMTNLKKFHLIKTFKAGLKSLHILKEKRVTMRNYIANSSANILISTRLEITKLLNKYAKNKITIHEEHTYPSNISAYLKKLKKACTHISYIIAVSKELTNIISNNIPNSKSIYLPNFLNYWPHKTSPLTSKNIISIGRLSPEKGFLELITIFKKINEQDNSFELHIIGDGKEYSKIKEKIALEHLENKITLHGFQNKAHINKCLENSTLYLMSSYEESFGLVLIEAASFGVPSIAYSRARGATEIIQNNKSGYLIPDSNQELYVKKTLELLHNPEKLQQFGKQARLIAQEFSFNQVKQKYLNFFKTL